MYIPARKIKAKVKGYRGKEPFFSSGLMIHWDSFLERDYIRLADFDQDVHELYHQPLCIHYMQNGKRLRYFPDFKVILKNGKTLIVEVKPFELLDDPKNQIKFEVGRRYCEEKGWLYQVFTEREIRPGELQQNLSILRRVKLHRTDPVILKFLLDEFSKCDEIDLISFRNRCSDIEDHLFYLHLHSLVYEHMIKVDLVDEKLNEYSELR
ncbi:TnsA endonuclease N-terminal domain-containing protein [Paenibacillus taichungensis]|uniref:TnsA endonuclease N-terminal domain-containing protein n=1 Tax=Paenibacillus taichungensis TaxID=484184 RepID=UPI00287263B9|nr:TnsA endonuclease N-terminal domain-containing protein [Paenibacillus taichungensis]MDR9748544.1 TnsA endonuclease N-terminal domain-containing protein [Paenibacillus taichungensis]